jgi:protocatechuate 3,4-dioxygenase beta subunit
MARARLSLLLYVVCAPTFAQPSGHGVISGAVVDASTNDPVRKAVVTATWQGTPRSWATTRTDGSGRFVFEGLPAGKYNLTATKAGLGTATYGASSTRELGDLVTLGDGETCANLKLRFMRAGSVSGRVLDPDGDPVSGVSVNLLRPGRTRGERVLLNYRSATTNDKGEYKIPTFDPGEFYLRCNPIFARQMVPVNHEMVGPQYFRGARESKDAAALNLRAGEVLTGLDFHLTAERPARITGRVTGVPPLDPPAEGPNQVNAVNGIRRMVRGGGPQVTIDLSPADDTQMAWNNSVGVQGPEYHFELPENVPGRYRVQANIHTKDKAYYATQVVDAREGTTDIVLALSPALELKGHLKIEGPSGRPIQSFTVALAPGTQGPRRETYSSPVGKDGSFAIEQLPPGEWVMTVTPTPVGTFEKSVRLGDKDFIFKLIEIPPGSDAPLDIVLSSNTAIVEGEIDADASGSKRAGILLEPVGDWHTLTRFYYSAISDDTGKFKLAGIAPGKYRIFALEKIATTSYRNPESADLLDAVFKELAEDLELPEGAKVTSHPKLIPEDKAKEILKP